MSYSSKDVTKDEINLWKKNKLINPRTNRKIKLDSKIYKYLQKMEKSMNKPKKIKIKNNKIIKKDNSDKKLEESVVQTELISVVHEESLTQTDNISKSDVFIQTDSSNNDIENLKNKIIEMESINDSNKFLVKEKESEINNLNEKLKIKENESIELKKSINNLDNNNNNLKNELNEKNKLLEENNKKIEELKNQIKNNYETNKPNPNNLMLVVPIAILCIGWVIKKSFFGF